MRKDKFDIQYAGGQFTAVQSDMQEQEYKDIWTKPLRARWAQCTDTMFCEVDPSKPAPTKERPGFLKVDDSTNNAAYVSLTDSSLTKVTAMINCPDTNPPAESMAGGAFHDVALQVFKAIHVTDSVFFSRNL